jgi:hypothetical protein
MNQMQKCKQDQIKKLNHRLYQEHANKHKHVVREPSEEPNIPRSLMFGRLKEEVKKEFLEKQGDPKLKQMESRRERRRRLIALAKKTVNMLREQGAHVQGA